MVHSQTRVGNHHRGAPLLWAAPVLTMKVAAASAQASGLRWLAVLCAWPVVIVCSITMVLQQNLAMTQHYDLARRAQGHLAKRSQMLLRMRWTPRPSAPALCASRIWCMLSFDCHAVTASTPVASSSGSSELRLALFANTHATSQKTFNQPQTGGRSRQ